MSLQIQHLLVSSSSSVPLEVTVDPDPLYVVNTPSLDTIWRAEGDDDRYYSIAFSFVGNSPSYGQVKINEVGGLSDGKDSIWIELVNLDTQSVALSGWSLAPEKWKAGNRLVYKPLFSFGLPPT